MSTDFNEEKEDVGQGALYMFLKYSPDSLLKLFDLCIVKPCYEQVLTDLTISVLERM
jgi:hypothetical protein